MILWRCRILLNVFLAAARVFTRPRWSVVMIPNATVSAQSGLATVTYSSSCTCFCASAWALGLFGLVCLLWMPPAPSWPTPRQVFTQQCRGGSRYMHQMGRTHAQCLCHSVNGLPHSHLSPRWWRRSVGGQASRLQWLPQCACQGSLKPLLAVAPASWLSIEILLCIQSVGTLSVHCV